MNCENERGRILYNVQLVVGEIVNENRLVMYELWRCLKIEKYVPIYDKKEKFNFIIDSKNNYLI